MKRILGAAAAALMSASLLAAPAFAQSDPSLGGGESEIGVSPGSGLDYDTTAAVGNSFEQALSAIEGSAASAQAITTMSDVDTVNVVRIGDLEGNDPAAIDRAVDASGMGANELQTSISANPALQQELQAQGVDVSSVVAAQVEADGSVTVYVR